MISSNYVSKKTRKLLLIVGFALFTFSFISLCAYTIKDQVERDSDEQKQAENAAKGLPAFSGPYCFPDKHSQFLSLNILLAGLIFGTAFFSKTFLFSAFFSGMLFSRYVYWYYDTQKALSLNELYFPQGLNHFFYKATIFDLLTLSILSILFFWQISVLLRILIKTIQKEESLP